MMLHATTANRPPCCLRTVSLLLAGLLLLGLACLPRTARADCWFTPPGGPADIIFSPSSPLSLSGLTPGQSIGPLSSVALPFALRCEDTTQSSLTNVHGGPVGSDDTLFPTGIPGISYRILQPDASHALASSSTIASGTVIDGTVSLQLVYTGPLPTNGRQLSGTLGQWKIDICADPEFAGKDHAHQNSDYKGCKVAVTPTVVATFSMGSGSIKFDSPTCSVATDPTVVTLPNVMTSQFTGPGSHAGDKSFNVQLTCPQSSGGLQVSITLDSNDKVAGEQGVIKPTQGSNFAQGVGVQVLDGNGDPLDFGSPIPVGNVNVGNFNIPLRAHYYQTGASVTGGEVKAAATYTLTYQ